MHIHCFLHCNCSAGDSSLSDIVGFSLYVGELWLLVDYYGDGFSLDAVAGFSEMIRWFVLWAISFLYMRNMYEM